VTAWHGPARPLPLTHPAAKGRGGAFNFGVAAESFSTGRVRNRTDKYFSLALFFSPLWAAGKNPTPSYCQCRRLLLRVFRLPRLIQNIEQTLLPESVGEGEGEMTANVLPKIFTIEIGDTPTLTFQAQNLHEAQELCHEQWLKDDLAEAKSDGVPLWDGKAKLRARIALPDESALFCRSQQNWSAG
jgi:hypothetical protein